MTAIGHARPADEDRARRLQELAELLAGARDLDGDYDSTIELARHLRRRRRATGQPADVAAVLADLEATLRASTALVGGIPASCERLHGEQLTEALATARREFDRRLGEHLAYARTALEGP